jgi:hypothetical protein
MRHSIPPISLGLSLAPFYKLEDFMGNPRFYLWDIIFGVLFIGLGVGWLIFGDRLLLSLLKGSFRNPISEKLARLIALVLGVVFILSGIIVGLDGLYSLFVIY